MTTRVRVDLGERSYDVVIGENAIAELDVLAGRRRAAVVTQNAIPAAVCEAVETALDDAGVESATFEIVNGETAKSMETVEDLMRGFAQWGLLRGDAIVAVGGGVVGDTAGFAASVYYRGVDVVQVPTTLLAMVDSAIGGKTGVNLPEGKNLVGAFHQPLAVIADATVLGSLPDREYRCGLGEVAKYALMGDDFVAEVAADLARRNPVVLDNVIVRCAQIKAHYVALDEYERSGARAVLNYGHTLAHALETATAHTLLHGEAVGIGLVFAGHLAGALERIDPGAVAHHEHLVASLGLSTIAPPGLRADELLSIMARDKKSAGGLTFMLAGPNGIERVDDPDPAAVRKALSAVGVSI